MREMSEDLIGLITLLVSTIVCVISYIKIFLFGKTRKQKFMEKAIEKGYYIRLYYVGLNTVEESLVRIENRVKRVVTTYRIPM